MVLVIRPLKNNFLTLKKTETHNYLNMDKMSPENISQKAPHDFNELISKLNSIVGKSIETLANEYHMPLPISPLHGKGFIGELMEMCLGATAKNQSIPDFPELGLELKTLPVDSSLKPLESTFITYAPIDNIRFLTFEKSSLYAKMSRMLFVIVLSTRSLGYDERKVLGYFFYTPSKEDFAQIKNDYEEIYEQITTGNIEHITAKFGSIVQLRPKCANGKNLTRCIGPDGENILTRPRGFYLRRAFTEQLVERCLHKENF